MRTPAAGVRATKRAFVQTLETGDPAPLNDASEPQVHSATSVRSESGSWTRSEEPALRGLEHEWLQLLDSNQGPGG